MIFFIPRRIDLILYRITYAWSMYVFKRPPKKIIKRTYYSNGKLRSKSVSISDDMSRVWTVWYKNGQKKYRGIYTNYTKDGSKWTYWHDNGMKKCEGTLIRLDHHKEMDIYIQDKDWTCWYEDSIKKE